MTGLARKFHPAYPESARFFREPGDADTWKTMVVIGENTEQIQPAGPAPHIELRFGVYGVYDDEGALPMVLLIGVGIGRPYHIYQLWINAAPDGGRPFLDDLASQSTLRIDFYGRGGVLVRSETVANAIRGKACDAIRRLSERPPWSVTAYDCAQYCVLLRDHMSWTMWHQVAANS